jgi:hypothetical protein
MDARRAIATEVAARRSGRRIRVVNPMKARDIGCNFCNAGPDEPCWASPTRRAARSHPERIANARRLSA